MTLIAKRFRDSAALGLFAFFCQSCATHCKPETAVAPAKTNFVRSEIPMADSEKRYPVWITKSAGEPVLFLHALNGLSPEMLKLSLEMESWGYRIYMPCLYGESVDGLDTFGFDEALLMSKKLKKHPDWNFFSATDPGPILDDVAEMSRWLARRESGRDLVVIGNCLTGNFPLALLEQPAVKTAVIAQPALPAMRDFQVLLRFPQLPHRRRALVVPDPYLASSFEAMKADPEKRIVGFHYCRDPLAPLVKFDRLSQRLMKYGLEDRFTAFVLQTEGVTYGGKRRWVVSDSTEEKRKMLTPHSTIVNPENRVDRDWFRARLREELASR